MLVLAGLGGCDRVFGLTGLPDPCALDRFDDAAVTDLLVADDFSFTEDRSYGVVVRDGATFEVAGGDPVPFDLSIYPSRSLGLAPEGELLLYTGSIEPPLLSVAIREDGIWRPDDRPAPKGVFAGAPSALDFGPRRTIVQLRDARPEVQEYEEDAGGWQPVGEPHAIDASGAPNLTPDGLTMAYVVRDSEGNTTVVAASRESTDDWFGDPRPLLDAEALRAPQLFGGRSCDELRVGVAGELRSYRR